MRLITLYSILFISIQTFAQKVDPPCPKPTSEQIKELCETIYINDEVKGDDANYFAYTYERDLWDMACADPRKDSWEEGKAKFKRCGNSIRPCLSSAVVGAREPLYQ